MTFHKHEQWLIKLDIFRLISPFSRVYRLILLIHYIALTDSGITILPYSKKSKGLENLNLMEVDDDGR